MKSRIRALRLEGADGCITFVLMNEKPKLRTNSEKEWFEKVLGFCSFQERNSGELLEKMSRDWMIPEAMQNQILKMAEEEGLLNDERFIDSFVRGHLRKGWGRIKIRRALEEKNLSKEHIEKNLENIDEVLYEESLYHQITSKVKGKIEDLSFAEKGKLAKKWIGKGYESYLVWKIVKGEYVEDLD